jgi:periplasmic divalent cation tolerance protein
MSQILVYITTAGRDEAERIGTLLVERRLAACVNMIDGMRSIYWWEGKMDRAEETILLAKTKAGLLEELTALVKSVHSYKCPCVVALPIVGGHPDFLRWIDEETK